MTRASLRLPHHRGTTAHLGSLYPFSLSPSFGCRGVYVGLDLLAGGAEFCWDPFEAYQAGLATNPNAWVLGEPGNGKSALVKCLLYRMAALYGTGPTGRWIAIADPKGEYVDLGQRLGLSVVRLAPGGTARLNPLATHPHPEANEEDGVLRRAGMVTALAATVLERPLAQLEDAAVFTTVETLTTNTEPATLGDVARLLAAPTAEMAQRLRKPPGELTGELAGLTYALDKLLTRSLRGMFDGPSTVEIAWDGPGVILDLSAIPLSSDALPLVMVAAAGWLGELVARPGRQRVQVLDEAWALLGNRHTASYLQTCFKLGRTYGVANVCVTHRPSDLGAQADDGTATAKIAAGLLADSATKIILRQAPDQLEAATTAFGLTTAEAGIVARLVRGRALWKIAARSAVVHHLLSTTEAVLCDTDTHMTAHDRPRTAVEAA